MLMRILKRTLKEIRFDFDKVFLRHKITQKIEGASSPSVYRDKHRSILNVPKTQCHGEKRYERYIDPGIHNLFYKNPVYKNHEAQILEILRIF